MTMKTTAALRVQLDDLARADLRAWFAAAFKKTP